MIVDHKNDRYHRDDDHNLGLNDEFNGRLMIFEWNKFTYPPT